MWVDAVLCKEFDPIQAFPFSLISQLSKKESYLFLPYSLLSIYIPFLVKAVNQRYKKQGFLVLPSFSFKLFLMKSKMLNKFQFCLWDKFKAFFRSARFSLDHFEKLESNTGLANFKRGSSGEKREASLFKAPPAKLLTTAVSVNKRTF